MIFAGHGRRLLHRMEPPEWFLRRMNRLSIEMTQQARRAGSKKGRKQVLRKMKALVNTVQAHARRHRDVLDKDWAQTQLTRRQAEVVRTKPCRMQACAPQTRYQAPA